MAHHVSAIAIQAQAGRALAASRPESSVEALEVIEAEASRTLAEMRAMVRVLRNQSPADYAPQAGIADLERLAGASPAGPQVQVKLSGDLTALPAAVDAAVYRIAQEAVTNALRHARNATLVEVRVDGDPSSIRLTRPRRRRARSAAGRPAPGSASSAWSSGRRCSAAVCSAGPCPERGWLVEATLPREVTG